MRFSFSFILTLITFLSFSQSHFCGIDAYYNKLYKQEPGLKEAMEEHLDHQVGTPFHYRGNEKVIIPVVFHVIHTNGTENIPYEKFTEVIDRINQDYQGINDDLSQVRDQFKTLIASMNIEFRIAHIDPEGNCSNGVTRTYSEQTQDADDQVKKLIQWEPGNYLNIWVVKSIKNFSQSGIILGYATFPGGASWRDGIVIRSDRINNYSRTLTHEIGHYLGLYHTFQGGCSNNDQVDDTPPEAEAHFDCNTNTNSCSTDSPDLPDLLENHMSYSSCRFMFTNGQKDRMLYYLTRDRKNLYDKNNLEATGTFDTNSFSCNIKADFDIIQQNICEQGTIQFSDLSNGGKQEISYHWFFDGGNPSESTQKNPEVQYLKAGYFTVKLVIASTDSKDSMIRNELITVTPDTGYQTPVGANFEDPLYHEQDWQLPGAGQTVKWKLTTQAGYNSANSIYLNNYSNKNEDGVFEFTMAPMSFATLPDVSLKFKYAYAKKSESSNDHLRIYVSSNCGESWSVRKFISPTKLPTVTGYKTTQYFPAGDADWKQESINLDYYKGNPNIRVRFSFYAGLGNNIFIDDINIVSSVSTHEPVARQNISMFPNPAKDKLTVRLETSPEAEEISITVFNLMGQKLYSGQFKTTERLIHFNIKDLNINSSGLYFFRLQEANRIYERKIIINR